MKRVISLLLSVMMLAGLFIALVPTASAASEGRKSLDGVSYVQPPSYTKGEEIMSENFENLEDTALANKELLDALGWGIKAHGDTNKDGYSDNDTALPGSATASIREGINGNNALYITSASTLDQIVFASDDRLGGGDYIVEYTFRMTNAALAASSGSNVGVMSSGQFNNTVEDRLFWYHAIKHRGSIDHYAGFIGANAGECGASIDLAAADGATSSSGSTDCLYNETWTVRVVVDAEYGFSVYTVDADGSTTLISAMANQTAVNHWKSDSYAIGNEVRLRILSNVHVLIDDISVHKIQRAKREDYGFLITSVGSDVLGSSATADVVTGTTAANSNTIETDEKGNYLYKPDGTPDNVRFEYIEVYNASTKALNIYDYAVARKSLGATTGNIWAHTVDDTDVHNILHGAGAAGTGHKAITAAGYSYTYSNPEYSEGVIQPGETAILMIPNNWWYANAPTVGTVETFKKLFLQDVLGMSETECDALNIFTFVPPFDGTNGSAFGMNNSGIDVMAMVPVGKDTAASTSAVVGKNLLSAADAVVDVRSTIFAYHRKNGYNGNTAKVAAYYDFWNEDGEYIVGGSLISSKLSTENTHPGFVAETARRPFEISYMVDGEVFKTECGYLKTAYSLTDTVPTKPGYVFDGWIDAEGNAVTDIAAVDMTRDLIFTAMWKKDTEARWLGYQTTDVENGVYDLRLVSSIGSLENVESIGFVVSVDDGAEKTVYLHYVYETITADFGSNTIELPHNGYFVALAIKDCPEAVRFTVKPHTVYTDGTSVTGGAVTVTYEEEPVKSIDLYLIAGQSNAGGHTKIKDAAALYAKNPELEQGISQVLYAGNARSSSGSTLYDHDVDWTATRLGFGRVDGSAQLYMGPEVGMASALSAYYNAKSGKTAGIIKMAHGGTSLLNKTGGMNQFGNWVPPSYAEYLDVSYENQVGGLYRALLEQVRTNVAALQEMGYEEIRICGIYWMQGEADSSTDSAVLAEYERALTYLVSDLRGDLADIMVELTGEENGAETMPFIIGTVSTTCGAVSNPQATIAKHTAFNSMLAEVVPELDRCYLVDNSSYDTVRVEGTGTTVVGSDQYHWNQSDAYEIGTHVGECILNNQLYTKDSK